VESFHYLLVLLFISICAVGVNFGFKLNISRSLKIFLKTDLLILSVYLIWDFWAVSKGSWYFDSNQILGLKIFGQLPIEEILFFVIVPLMSVLTYLALIKLTGWGQTKEEPNDLR
jgi:lycopene cyclase domain-containing protein